MAECPDCGGAMPVSLSFNPEAYTEVSALLSAFVYGDADAVEEILETAARDLASAALIVLYSAVARIAELDGSSIGEQLKAIGLAALAAAEEES